MRPSDNPYILAADIGGTHITAAAVRTQDWTILPASIVRNHVDSSASAKSILSDWVDAITTAAHLTGEASMPPIGVAIPGPFDYDNGISLIKNQDKYDALHQLNVKQEITSMLSISPLAIRFINDAAAFLQGEVYGGGYDGHRKILGFTLGTGLGSAIWERGGNAIDADLWNTPYQDSIMEEYLATRWFVNTFHQKTGIRVKGLKELLQLRQQHGVVDDMLAEYSQHLLAFLHFFSNRENTDTFVIGGNIAKAWPEIHAFAPGAFDEFRIHVSKLGENAALIGAAATFI